eukprot:12755667-Ditylum_brightwellii.AAC.1
MACAIRDGPSHLGGAEFTPLYHLQGVQQVHFFCAPIGLILIQGNSYKWQLHGYSTSQGGKFLSLKIQQCQCHTLNPGGYHLFKHIWENTDSVLT